MNEKPMHTMMCDCSGVLAEREANAALIAAAPELLAQLKALVKLSRNYVDGGETDEMCAWAEATVEADEIIAKARPKADTIRITKQKCAHPGCMEMISRQYFMCPGHWWLVPWGDQQVIEQACYRLGAANNWDEKLAAFKDLRAAQTKVVKAILAARKGGRR